MTLHRNMKCQLRQFTQAYVFYMPLHLGSKWNEEKLLSNEYSSQNLIFNDINVHIFCQNSKPCDHILSLSEKKRNETI